MNDDASRYRVAMVYLTPSNKRPIPSEPEGGQRNDWDLSMVDLRPKPGDGFYFDGEYDPRVFEPCETDAERLAEVQRVREAEQAVEWSSRAIGTLTDHLASLGAIRADGAISIAIGGEAEGCDAEFLFIYEDSSNASNHLASLGNLEAAAAEVSCKELPGFKLTAEFLPADEGAPLSVQSLFDAMAKLEAPAGIGVWDGTGTPERLPQEGESLSGWLERVALSAAELAAMAARWEAVGRDVELFKVFGTHLECGGAQGVEWLVRKVLARGSVTSLVGTNGVGKSTIAHEWAAILAGEPLVRPRTILGQEVQGHHVVALVSGEDSRERVNERSAKLATVWGASPGYRFDGTATRWEALLQQLERTPKLDLVILDPVRVAMAGNEDLSGDVSNFYDDLARLARKQNCAVLVVHHLSKGRPRRLSDMRQMVRGSGVHVDRPRMVIGILGRADGLVEIGPLKHNFDADSVWAKLYEGTLYQRDPASDTLIPLADAIENSVGSARSDRVLAAIAGLNRAGQIVRRSGKTGLFEMRLPELAGLSRNAILEAIEELTESGAVSNSTDGGLVAEKAP